MPTVHAKIDNRIRLWLPELPVEAGYEISEALTIENGEKKKALEQKDPNADSMPDHYVLWRYDNPMSDRVEDEIMSVPRGFRETLEAGLAAKGCDIEWIDQRRSEQVEPASQTPSYRARPFQPPAVKALKENTDMIYKAPPGSGKTVSALAAANELQQRTCVVVHTTAIINQWADRAREHLGEDYPVGRIGDGNFEMGNLTICTVQTLWSRFDRLRKAGFFDRFGIAILDECHHATARTFAEVMDAFTARWRWGLSATPEKTGEFRVAEAVLGGVKHTTSAAELEASGTNIRPTIVRVATKLGFGFRGASLSRPSNYKQLERAVIRDEDRNAAIVKCVMANRDHHNLALTKRLEHIDTLTHMLNEAGYDKPIYHLTGREKSAERDAVVEAISNHPGIVFSTLADEALDIPRLDRGYLTFPQKNTDLIEQQLGRFRRAHPLKEDAVVYDFADLNVGPCKAQYRARLLKVYKPQGMNIINTKVDDLADGVPPLQ